MGHVLSSWCIDTIRLDLIIRAVHSNNHHKATAQPSLLSGCWSELSAGLIQGSTFLFERPATQPHSAKASLFKSKQKSTPGSDQPFANITTLRVTLSLEGGLR